MSRKRFGVYYHVECLGHWFDNKGYKSSFRSCKTFKKAVSVAKGIKNLHPDKEAIVTRFSRKKGERWSQEFVF